MATLSLLTTPTHPNASRRITAPGGYESWRFSATSDDGSIHVVAELHAAWALDRAALRRYWAYRRFPTRVRPPNPSRHPAVTFALYERGRQPIVLTTRLAAEDFSADDAGRSVRVGGSHAQRGTDDAVHLNVRGATTHGQTIAARLTLRPHVEGGGEVMLFGAPDGRDDTIGSAPRDGRGVHGWVIADPLCDVNGEISVFREAGGPPRVIPFAGVGCHDHYYGTRPLADAADEWLSGRIVLEDHALLFRRAGSDAAHVCEARAGQPLEIRTEAIRTDGVSRTARGVVYPAAMTIAGVAELAEPKVIDSSWHGVVLEYRATIGNDRAVALVELLRPKRVVWPLWWGGELSH
ncbi:MAG: hypothetical protein ABIP55_06355 [Tepidisphaeraceae bacterium]